jgi:DNA-binding NarL/FixJ family response regulator
MDIRVLLADDHQILREGLRTLLNSQDDMEVVAEAADGREAVRLARALQPHVIIMDIGMSGMNGMEATQQLTQALPDIKVVALSMHLKKTFVKEMLKAGAVGYILKENAFAEVIEAIHRVVEGERYLCQRVINVLAEDYAAGGTAAGEAKGPDALSERDREIIRLLAEGKSSKEIARMMDLSVKTIDAYRRRIMEKLGINNLADLVKYAIREGLTSVEQ